MYIAILCDLLLLFFAKAHRSFKLTSLNYLVEKNFIEGLLVTKGDRRVTRSMSHWMERVLRI